MTEDGSGMVQVLSGKNREDVRLSQSVGKGTITTYQPSGKEWVELGVGPNGGYVEVYNKIGENVVDLYADGYGNGVGGAWNRKGQGRTLQSGP